MCHFLPLHLCDHKKKNNHTFFPGLFSFPREKAPCISGHVYLQSDHWNSPLRTLFKLLCQLLRMKHTVLKLDGHAALSASTKDWLPVSCSE